MSLLETRERLKAGEPVEPPPLAPAAAGPAAGFLLAADAYLAAERGRDAARGRLDAARQELANAEQRDADRADRDRGERALDARSQDTPPRRWLSALLGRSATEATGPGRRSRWRTAACSPPSVRGARATWCRPAG